jgi:hypothetical protein
MRKLAIFALLSLIAHWVIVSDISLPDLRRPAEPPPLRVRLQAAPTLPPLVARPTAPTTPATPSPGKTPATAGTINNAYDAPVSAATTPRSEETAPVIATPAAETPSPAVAPPAAPADAKALARRLPRSGEISYELYLGNNRFQVGRTVQSWTINDGAYRVRSTSETTGNPHDARARPAGGWDGPR